MSTAEDIKRLADVMYLSAAEDDYQYYQNKRQALHEAIDAMAAELEGTKYVLAEAHANIDRLEAYIKDVFK